MTIECDGKSIETTETGFLVNTEDWSESLAQELARNESIELGREH